MFLSHCGEIIDDDGDILMVAINVLCAAATVVSFVAVVVACGVEGDESSDVNGGGGSVRDEARKIVQRSAGP